MILIGIPLSRTLIQTCLRNDVARVLRAGTEALANAAKTYLAASGYRTMAPRPQILGPGAFFGTARRDLRTPYFVFSEMSADFSREGVPKHTHVGAHFVLVVKGVYFTAAQPNQGLCGPSTLIFNPSGTTHQDRFQSQGGRFLSISVSPEVSAEAERTIHHPVAFTSGKMATTARKAYLEFQDLNHFSELVMEGLGLELIGKLGLARTHSDPTPPRWLRRAQELIRDCCTRRVTVRDVAREANVHPIHLARTFRQYFGNSPGEYLRRCRMERVQHLLASSEIPLADLALQTGFADQSQLTNSFKQFTGITPGEFRRAFAKKRIKRGKNVSFSQDSP